MTSSSTLLVQPSRSPLYSCIRDSSCQRRPSSAEKGSWMSAVPEATKDPSTFRRQTGRLREDAPDRDNLPKAPQMGESAFTPASRFGIPLHQFPPGLPWDSLQDLLLDATADLRHAWVRSHVLGISPEVSHSVLSTSSKVTKSVAVSIRGHGGPEQISSGSLFVDAFTREEVTVGVCVEANQTPRPPRRPKGCRLSVFTRNVRAGTACIVSHNQAAAVVDLTFHSVSGLASSYYVELRFCAPRFFVAFEGGAPDLEALERCIISSWVGYTARLMAGCRCATPGCIECRGAGVAQPSLLSRKEFVHIVEAGDCTFKAVLGLYDGGKLVSATPTFAVVNRQAAIESGTMRNMVEWGVRDCVRRRKPVVSSSVFATYMGEPGMSCTHCAIDNILSGGLDDGPEAAGEDVSVPAEVYMRTTTANQHVSYLEPQASWLNENASAESNSLLSTSTPWANNASSLRMTKLELRKIRNRECAFRASAKRSERRRIARIAKQAATTTNRDGDSIPVTVALQDEAGGF